MFPIRYSIQQVLSKGSGWRFRGPPFLIFFFLKIFHGHFSLELLTKYNYNFLNHPDKWLKRSEVVNDSNFTSFWRVCVVDRFSNVASWFLMCHHTQLWHRQPTSIYNKQLVKERFPFGMVWYERLCLVMVLINTKATIFQPLY